MIDYQLGWFSSRYTFLLYILLLYAFLLLPSPLSLFFNRYSVELYLYAYILILFSYLLYLLLDLSFFYCDFLPVIVLFSLRFLIESEYLYFYLVNGFDFLEWMACILVSIDLLLRSLMNSVETGRVKESQA